MPTNTQDGIFHKIKDVYRENIGNTHWEIWNLGLFLPTKALSYDTLTNWKLLNDDQVASARGYKLGCGPKHIQIHHRIKHLTLPSLSPGLILTGILTTNMDDLE